MLTVGRVYPAVVIKTAKNFMICRASGSSVFIHASEIADQLISGVDDYFFANDQVKLKVTGFDPETRRYVGSFKSVAQPNPTERTKPLPTPSGFANLMEQTKASAERLADRAETMAEQPLPNHLPNKGRETIIEGNSWRKTTSNGNKNNQA